MSTFDSIKSNLTPFISKHLQFTV